MKLLVASYNIQHGIYFPAFLENGCRDATLEPVIAFLKEKSPDICGFNEIYGEGSIFGNQPKLLADGLGYDYVFGRAIDLPNGPYGNAIITRYPIKSSRTIEIKTDPDSIKPPRLYHEDRALLIAEIDVNGTAVTVMTCHFGLNVEEAEAAAQVITNELTRIQSPTVLMGDFNITPDNALVQALSKLLNDTACGKPQLTFPSNSPERKIDYIFASRDIEIESSWVEQVVIADHCPLFAILKI